MSSIYILYYIGKILIIVPMCSGFSLVRRQASLRGHSALKLSLEQQKRFPALFAKSLTIVYSYLSCYGCMLHMHIIPHHHICNSRHGHTSHKFQLKSVSACNAKLHLNLVAESMIAAWRKRFETWHGIDSNSALPSYHVISTSQGCLRAFSSRPNRLRLLSTSQSCQNV